MPKLSFPLFKEHPAKAEARQLLAAVCTAARAPDFYGEGRVPDTFDGRFQVLTLHGVLTLRRLTALAHAEALAQAFTDAVFLNFDDGLREAGVGDLSVPKHMKKIGQAFYGRYGVYDAALTALDRPALAAALSRNIWSQDDAPFADALAGHVMTVAARLAAMPVDKLSDANTWRDA